MGFSQHLKAILKRDDLTVPQLAKKTGIPAKTIYHYLDGRTPRNLNHVRLICDALKVSSDYLLFGVESMPPLKEEIIPFGTFDVFLRKKEG